MPVSKYFNLGSSGFIIISCAVQIFAQSELYYSTISTSSPTFINDLKTRIRIPYTKVSYDLFDETNIANFTSIDNGNGTKSVFCVYSNYEYNYSGIFTWLPLSREHTYAHSWQPTYNATNGDEYSDQHHLFPAHQNNANAKRANYPLGIVTNPTYIFLESKLGTDANSNTVYEPRDAHKGDAARALFYMIIRYDGIDGNSWTFDWLNSTRIPSLNPPVAPQDVATLISWHKQDPPDKWEVDRNNYIQSIQQNRNPFVDHPEWVNFINFNNLTTFSPIYAVEPTNYVTNFSADTLSNSITVDWIDAVAGIQSPSGYLLMAFNKNNYFIPIDGSIYSDDTNLSDGAALVNISYDALNTYTFDNLTFGSSYYFSIYSYNGNGSERNYKIVGSVPTANATTSGGVDPLAAGDIAIIGFNMDNPDEFAFVPLVDLPIGTVIKFTDNGWLNAGSFRSSEGLVTYTSSSVVPKGTVKVFNSSSPSSEFTFTTEFSLSADGDQILAYTGSDLSPTFLYAINSDGTDWQADATSSNTSALPLGLTNGITAVALDEIDNAIYNGLTNILPQDFLISVSNKNNWTGSNTVRQTMPGGIFSLPVNLVSFSARIEKNDVVLTWLTATESNSYGFEIESSVSEITWKKIGFVHAAGNSNSFKHYEYRVRNQSYEKYFYRLKQIDVDGSFEYSAPIEVLNKSKIEFELSQNYPNPFNPLTKIDFSIPEKCHVKIKIYDIIGCETALLVNSEMEFGNYSIDFDSGKLASGVYFYQLEAMPLSSFEQVYKSIRKMIITK